MRCIILFNIILNAPGFCTFPGFLSRREAPILYHHQYQIISLSVQSTFIVKKVKTNNVNAIDAKPCIGSIQPNENIKITVRRNSTSTEQVKLQITYTECPEELTKENFK